MDFKYLQILISLLTNPHIYLFTSAYIFPNLFYLRGKERKRESAVIRWFTRQIPTMAEKGWE